MSHDNAGLREDAEQSADWLIARLELEASVLGKPFDDWERWVLRQSFDSLSETTISKATEVHDYAVELMKSAVVREIASSGHNLGDPNLEIPGQWLTHHESMRRGELPWVVFIVSYSVFFGNEVNRDEVHSDIAGPRQNQQAQVLGQNQQTKPGFMSIGVGFGIAAIGLLVTFATYTAASPGGTYVVAWGAMLFGAFEGLRGIYRYLRS
jgi:hypothetical protein